MKTSFSTLSEVTDISVAATSVKKATPPAEESSSNTNKVTIADDTGDWTALQIVGVPPQQRKRQ
jgi:hypothetical protein